MRVHSIELLACDGECFSSFPETVFMCCHFILLLLSFYLGLSWLLISVLHVARVLLVTRVLLLVAGELLLIFVSYSLTLRVIDTIQVISHLLHVSFLRRRLVIHWNNFFDP